MLKRLGVRNCGLFSLIKYHLTESKMNSKKIITAISLMTAASLSVVIPLLVFQQLFAVFIIYYFGFCLFLPIFDMLFIQKKKRQNFFHWLGFSNTNLKRSLIFGFIHGILFYIIIVGGFSLLKDQFSSQYVLNKINEWNPENVSKWYIFLIMVLCNGILEELFWRGYIYKKLESTLPAIGIIGLITFFYTSYHFATILTFFGNSLLSFLSIIGIASAGFLWGWFRHYYHTLWISTIGHVFATFAYMTIFLML
jgi:membrane protease YdiL (CAAX protease family)